MKDYHEAWLKVHPERSRLWLLEMQADGFDIHHVDGDRANNAPENLVLIEHNDHMSLHSLGRSNLRRCIGQDTYSEAVAAGKRCYETRISGGGTWADVEAATGVRHPMNRAKMYADHVGAEWPPRVTR